MNVVESEVVEVKKDRKGISKKLRMEIFKRDSFRCGYCGKSAPDVVLHIDHIKPVSKDGDNHPLNLVTACYDCNMGKSNVLLDDKSTLSKQKKQLDLLQERLEQQEMMFEWQKGLKLIEQDAVKQLAEYWNKIDARYSLNEVGESELQKCLRRGFSIEEIILAMDGAIGSYIKYDSDGSCNRDAWVLAFYKIIKICVVKRAEKENPGLGELLKIRSFFAKRVGLKGHFFPDVLVLLKNAHSVGVSVNRLYEICRSSRHFTQFSEWMTEEIEDMSKNYSPPTGAEFICNECDLRFKTYHIWDAACLVCPLCTAKVISFK